MEISTSLKIIDEICKEKNIKESYHSFGWIRQLNKEGKTRYIVRNTFDLNLAGATDIVNDKYATYEILKANDIKVLKHVMIFNPKTRKEFFQNLETQVEQALHEFGNKVVIKANNSCQGKDVFLLNNKNEIVEKIKELFIEGVDTVSICPYEDIEIEYRVIYLDGNIEFIYKKEKPYVLGDGKNKLRDLIGSYEISNLEVDEKLNLDYIPKNNEKVIISWKHNLSLGAIPKLVSENDKYINKIKEIAEKAGKAVNITFATIDVSQTKNGEIFVMEINANVCMSKFAEQVKGGYEISKKIYAKAIDKMFI